MDILICILNPLNNHIRELIAYLVRFNFRIKPGFPFETAPTTKTIGLFFANLGTNSLSLTNLAFVEVPTTNNQLNKIKINLPILNAPIGK